jgi:DNA polymerase-3 subunit epsilon
MPRPGRKTRIVTFSASTEPANSEELARRLEDTGNYRVLRRLNLESRMSAISSTATRTAMFLDVETTGLDPVSCDLLEIAIIPFDYTSDGSIVRIHPALHQLNEPTGPISSTITAITGLTDADVAGHRINVQSIRDFVVPASLIIAHNAAFDRPIVERFVSEFAMKPWACSMSDIRWGEEGIQSRRLSDLLQHYGYFFDAHRATDDCRAGIALLTMQLSKSSRSALAALLEGARRPTWRIFAVEAPYAYREILKQRGYHWNTRREFGPRSWWTDVEKDAVGRELLFLEDEIFHQPKNLPIFEITAFQRYACRVS